MLTDEQVNQVAAETIAHNSEMRLGLEDLRYAIREALELNDKENCVSKTVNDLFMAGAHRVEITAGPCLECERIKNLIQGAWPE